MRQFRLHFSMCGEYVDTAVIELADEVIDVVDDAWRAMFYNLRSSRAIARHVGYNLIINRILLSMMDGWADQPDGNARVVEWPDLDQWSIAVVEVEDE